MAILSVSKELPAIINLRPLDEAECLAGGTTGDSAVRYSAKASDDFFVISIDGQLAAVWGYATESLFSYRCRAWLLTCPILDQHKIKLARSSLRVMGWLFQRFDEVEICVHKKHSVALNWLDWLRFETVAQSPEFLFMVAKKESALWVS